MLPDKVDRKELYDLENKIMIGLRDMMAQMSEQYANNDDAMRRFALLS